MMATSNHSSSKRAVSSSLTNALDTFNRMECGKTTQLWNSVSPWSLAESRAR